MSELRKNFSKIFSKIQRDQKMNELRKKFSKILRSYWGPTSPRLWNLVSRRRGSKNEWVSKKSLENLPFLPLPIDFGISCPGKRSQKLSELWKHFLKNFLKILRSYSPLDFGISCPGKWSKNMSEFRKNFSKNFSKSLVPASPHRLWNLVSRKNLSQNEWVSKEFLAKFLENPSPLLFPRLWSLVSCPGEEDKKMNELRIFFPKSSVPTEDLLPSFLLPLDFGISCPGKGDQKNERVSNKIAENPPSLPSSLSSTLESRVQGRRETKNE